MAALKINEASVIAALVIALIATEPRLLAAQISGDQPVISGTAGTEAGPLGPPDIVDIPGVGPVDLSTLPPKLRNNIRRPGVVYTEPPEQYGDLPPLPQSPDVDEPRSIPELTSPAEAPPTPEFREDISQEEAMRRMYQKRAWPLGEIPEDAHLKAWQHIQEMQEAPPPALEAPATPQSLLRLGPGRWLARAWEMLAPPPAFAQSALWSQIGPAPFRVDNGAGLANAGRIAYVAVDPQNSARIYLGTDLGGLSARSMVAPLGLL
ncbi:MAG TPA: hypothetical protein VF515_12310 [Candidatus Binatia bacterium]